MKQVLVLVIVGLVVLAATGPAVAGVLRDAGLVAVPIAFGICLVRLVWYFTRRY
jgi:hypothetical protein